MSWCVFQHRNHVFDTKFASLSRACLEFFGDPDEVVEKPGSSLKTDSRDDDCVFVCLCDSHRKRVKVQFTCSNGWACQADEWAQSITCNHIEREGERESFNQSIVTPDDDDYWLTVEMLGSSSTIFSCLTHLRTTRQIIISRPVLSVTLTSWDIYSDNESRWTWTSAHLIDVIRCCRACCHHTRSRAQIVVVVFKF